MDWDADGDLDLWFKNRTGPQIRFMQNDGGGNGRFLSLYLTGTTSNRDAVGATVEVHAGDRIVRRTVVAGDGYLSQSSRWLHFGLAGAQKIERVVVHWPGGEPETVAELEIDRRYRIKQGTRKAIEVEAREVRLDSRPAVSVEPARPTRILLRAPLQMPPSVTTIADEGGEPERAKLINLWAHWCEPCLAELGDLADAYARVYDARIDVVALSVDAPEDRETAAAWFDERIASRMEHPAFGYRGMTPETMETIEAILRHVLDRRGEIVVPTSLLVDSRGLLQVIYLGPVTPEMLIRDAETWAFSRNPGSRRAVYRGRWYFRTPRNLGALAAELRRRGRRQDALYYYALQELREHEKAAVGGR